MLVLDTDLITIYLRGGGEAFQKLTTRWRVSSNVPPCVTIISFEEQMRGWLSYIAAVKLLEQQIVGYGKLHALLKDYQALAILDFDDVAAVQYAKLRNMKLRLGTMDMKIAAIALANDALLLSRNLKDFRKVPELKVRRLVGIKMGMPPPSEWGL